jgi:single-strand DNA-binding protein
MSNGNTVTICGTLGRDPELRFTPTGQAIASFSAAVNRRWQNRQTQEWEEATDWIDVVAWGQLGENVSESLHKGSRVIVSGRFQQRSWETQDGDKRSKIEIVADEVGPSLRWATAEVQRNERRATLGDARDATTTTAPARTTTTTYPPGYNPATGYDYDEEPF